MSHVIYDTESSDIYFGLTHGLRLQKDLTHLARLQNENYISREIQYIISLTLQYDNTQSWEITRY